MKEHEATFLGYDGGFFGFVMENFTDNTYSFTVPPQIAPITFGDQAAKWGEQVSSVCSVHTGDKPIMIEWRLNGKRITPKAHPDITISRSGKKLSLLNIDSVTADHAGEYTCVASNPAGSANRSTVLSIDGIEYSGI